MKITYDKEADAAYFYIGKRIKSGQVDKTVVADKSINLDYDEKGGFLA